MAEENPPLKHFLTCSVCTEIFKDPVSLGCHHSFCSSCLQNFWAQNKNKNCPLCRRKSSKDVVVNFSIKELAESYAARQRSDPSDEAQVVCTEHLKDIKWFCKEEQRAVCHVCEFPHHQGHTVVPLEEQVQELKQQLRPDLTALQARRSRHQGLEETYEAMVPHLKEQRVKTERRIRAEFEQLHRFLREEEEARVKAMREEEEARVKARVKAMREEEARVKALREEEEQKRKRKTLQEELRRQTAAQEQQSSSSCSVS